jgi:hypothetical protein
MGGLFVGTFVAYLYKSLSRLYLARDCATWRLIEGSVTHSAGLPGGFSCPRAEIVYIYDVNGHTEGGLSDRPFLLPTSAKSYADRFPKGKNVRIRVSPIDPSRSVLRDQDQIETNLQV